MNDCESRETSVSNDRTKFHVSFTENFTDFRSSELDRSKYQKCTLRLNREIDTVVRRTSNNDREINLIQGPELLAVDQYVALW